MQLNNQSAIFKFASIRNSKPYEPDPTIVEIELDTLLVTNIETISTNTVFTRNRKLIEVNKVLQDFIDSPSFFKTKAALTQAINLTNPNQGHLEVMYDNIIVRLLTQSNTNEVYGILLRSIKASAARLNRTTTDKIQIIIPEKLTFPFTEFEGNNVYQGPTNVIAAQLTNIQTLTEISHLIAEAKENDTLEFLPNDRVSKLNRTFLAVTNYFGQASISTTAAAQAINTRLSTIQTELDNLANNPNNTSGRSSSGGSNTDDLAALTTENQTLFQLNKLVQLAVAQNLTEISAYATLPDTTASRILTGLDLPSATIEAAERRVNAKLQALYNDSATLFKGNTYALVGKTWKNVSGVYNTSYVEETPTGTNIMVHTQGCYLKYPVRVADLRIVEQQTVGYIPAEIAHINNTQKGEKNTRVTRRLKRVETFESIINESEVTQETDTQSAEKFSVENQAHEVQAEENSWNMNATVSGAYGPVQGTVSGGYANSSLEMTSNTSSQSYAKEIFTRVMDRVSNRVRNERSVKTLEEFEETVTHEIDNSTQETKSYVYRWLNKLVKGTLKNYGKRLIFEFDVAHPSSYYLTRVIKEKPNLNLPVDLRTWSIQLLNGSNFSFTPNLIDRFNYIQLGNLYGIKLDAPPEQKLLISEVFNAMSGQVHEGKLIPIKKGYCCKSAVVASNYLIDSNAHSYIIYIIGNSARPNYNSVNDLIPPRTFQLNNETDNLPFSITQAPKGFIMNVKIQCELTPEAFGEWQLKCYYDLLAAYDKLKAEADVKVNEFDPNAPGLPPEKKRDLIKEELKKETIRKMYRCNPFWVNDNYQVGVEYKPDCCLDSSNAEKVKFLESVFDWRNMTYELHPYFYSNKNEWGKILDLEDDDPHFEAFLKASFATVRVPVFRDNLKEIAACNFIVNNAVGNYETVPQGMKMMLEELAKEQSSLFTYDLDGNELPVAKNSVDLGIFPVPTALVILECSNRDGVKPIGFPQTAPETTDVSIPKQYSPAIISDDCDTPTV